MIYLFYVFSLDEDKNTLNILSKQYIEMLEHNILEPYKFINVSNFNIWKSEKLINFTILHLHKMLGSKKYFKNV